MSYKKKCEFFNSTKKIKHLKRTMIQKNINILCYLSKEGKIALTKKNNLGFLNTFNLPQIENTKNKKNLRTGNYYQNIKILFQTKN